jgi:hypothetical protein
MCLSGSDGLAHHGCQMVYLQTKNTNFGVFLRAWNEFFCMYLLRQFGKVCGHLGTFGMFYEEKSGNPATHAHGHAHTAEMDIKGVGEI